MRTIEQTITAFYDCMSFDKGGAPSPDRLHDLFVPDGVMINYNGEQPQRLTVAGFIESFLDNVAKQVFPCLYGKEISHKTDTFGRIAQRFSVYEFRTNSHVSLGVDTIQLIQINGSWYITSMIWHDENETLKIPLEHLPDQS